MISAARVFLYFSIAFSSPESSPRSFSPISAFVCCSAALRRSSSWARSSLLFAAASCFFCRFSLRTASRICFFCSARAFFASTTSFVAFDALALLVSISASASRTVSSVRASFALAASTSLRGCWMVSPSPVASGAASVSRDSIISSSLSESSFSESTSSRLASSGCTV